MKRFIVLLLVLILIPFAKVNAAEKTIAQWETELNKVQKELDETNAKKR